jgi:hypothetical protein
VSLIPLLFAYIALAAIPLVLSDLTKDIHLRIPFLPAMPGIYPPGSFSLALA